MSELIWLNLAVIYWSEINLDQFFGQFSQINSDVVINLVEFGRDLKVRNLVISDQYSTAKFRQINSDVVINLANF